MEEKENKEEGCGVRVIVV